MGDPPPQSINSRIIESTGAMKLSEQDHKGYAAALAQARQGAAESGVPLGSSIFASGLLLGEGRNRRVQNGDPTAHAEN